MVVLWDIRTLRNEPPHMIAKFRAHGLDPGKVPALVASAAKVASVSPLLGAHHKGARPCTWHSPWHTVRIRFTPELSSVINLCAVTCGTGRL